MANALKIDLTDKVVKTRMAGVHFHCKGGFGCLPYTAGTRIYGTWLHTGEDGIITGHDVCEMISPDVIYHAEA